MRRGWRLGARLLVLACLAVTYVLAAIHLPRGFDSCRDYPGEGPEPGEDGVLTIGSANVTAWSSFFGAMLWGPRSAHCQYPHDPCSHLSQSASASPGALLTRPCGPRPPGSGEALAVDGRVECESPLGASRRLPKCEA